MRRRQPPEIEAYTTEELEKLIDLYIFSERDREMLKLRFFKDYSYTDLAEKYNYTYRHIQRIMRTAEDKLFKHLIKH